MDSADVRQIFLPGQEGLTRGNGGSPPSRLQPRLLLLDQLTTHQETGTLLFPLVTMQFFSSGLIMAGETVSEALVFTMGRDLWAIHISYVIPRIRWLRPAGARRR